MHSRKGETLTPRVLDLIEAIRRDEPLPATTVADKALTSEQTARKHLGSLVEHGYVTETASPDSKATPYRRANDSLAVEQARRILDETDGDTLSTRVLEMREQLREYGERFNHVFVGVSVLQAPLREPLPRGTKRRRLRTRGTSRRPPCGRCEPSRGRHWSASSSLSR